MAAANASAVGTSPLHELTGFYLAVDCRALLRHLWWGVEAAWLETGTLPQRKGQAAAGAAARAGGAGVAVAGCCLDNRHDRPIMTAARVLGSPCVLKV
jgi:hypothetical protein